MIIPEIKLTSEEMCEAVHQYLKQRGIGVPVEMVETSYTGGGKWRITLVDPDEKPAAPAIAPPPEQAPLAAEPLLTPRPDGA